MTDNESPNENDSQIETDPVQIVLAFARHLEGSRKIKTAKKVCPACKHGFDPLEIRDRDEYLITILLSILADPHHHIGKMITRNLFKTWIERGGVVPKQGQLGNTMREADQFDFAVQYLYDYGLPVKEIALALCVSVQVIYKHLRYVKNEDRNEWLRNNQPVVDEAMIK